VNWRVLLLSSLLGGLLFAAPTFLLTRAWYQRDALEARAELADTKTALATARVDLLTTNKRLSDVLLKERADEQTSAAAVADRVDELSRRVSLCANKSDVRVTVTPTGVIETVPNEQLRDLAESVREYANACGRGRDIDGIDHNKLVDWFERLPKELEAR
jgi:hypothetical protein